MAPKRSRKELSISKNISNKLLLSLHSQSKSGIFCDVKVLVGCASFPVHSCVLASYSPCLNSLMYPRTESTNEVNTIKCTNSSSFKLPENMDDHWSFRTPLELKLPLVDPEDCSKQNVECVDCASKVIDFMYLGKIDIQKEHLTHLKYFSKVLQVAELLEICNADINQLGSALKKKRICPNKTTIDNSVERNIAHSLQNIKSDFHIHVEQDVHEHSIENQDLYENKDLTRKNSNTNCDVPSCVNQSKAEEQAPYSCCECKLTFANSALFCQHQETHFGKLYRCYACQFSSHKTFELLKHLLESDHKERVCSMCMFEAENSEKLRQHLQQHNHPKPFFCSICNLRFPTRASLKLHSPKHSTETPFSCSVCNRGFKWKHGLQSHMVVHTTEKKHLCAQCGFSTAHKSTFNAHELVHAGFTFECPQAGCKFKTSLKRNISAHLSTHRNEKPYQCEICGRAFSQCKNLRRHALEHDASAHPYCCPLCAFQTMRIDKLKYHFKKHHAESDEQLLKLKRKKWCAENLRKEASEILLSLSCSEGRAVKKEVKKSSEEINESSNAASTGVEPMSKLGSNKSMGTVIGILKNETNIDPLIVSVTHPAATDFSGSNINNSAHAM